MILELTRLETGKAGTFGALRIDKSLFSWTLEPPDRWNTPDESCIPAGQYLVAWHNSATHGKTIEVLSVPGRVGILFHAGNVVGHTRGCIILGETIFKLHGDRALKNSGQTFERFLNRLRGHDTASLTIAAHY
jgi:hypothetical protein